MKINQPSPGSTYFQEPEKLRRTEENKLSQSISELKLRPKKWATLDLSYIEDLIERTIDAMSSVKTEWLELSTRKKGDEGNTFLTAEELFIFGAIGGI